MATTLRFPTAAFTDFVDRMDGLGDMPLARMRFMLGVLADMEREPGDIVTFPTVGALTLFAQYLVDYPEEQKALSVDHDAV